MKQYLCLDFGGTYVKYAFVDEQGKFYERGKIPSSTSSLDELLASIRSLKEKITIDYEGVAVSMPGRINTRDGIAHTGGAYLFIVDTPFAAILEEIFEKKVVIGNDAKCAAAAEVFNGALSDVDNGCVIVLGTGTGGGIVLNKKIWMGSSFGAGELSNLVTNFKPIPKDVPQDQVLNQMDILWWNKASATGLLGMYATKKGLPYLGHGIDGIQFFEAYDQGDKDAIEALEEFADCVAAGIMSIQAVLDLQKYAIGGGISARKEVTEAISKALDTRFSLNPLFPFMKPEVVTCKYENDANLLGAFSLFLEQTK